MTLFLYVLMILSYKNLYDRRKFALITDLVFFALAYKGSFFSYPRSSQSENLSIKHVHLTCLLNISIIVLQTFKAIVENAKYSINSNNFRLVEHLTPDRTLDFVNESNIVHLKVNPMSFKLKTQNIWVYGSIMVCLCCKSAAKTMVVVAQLCWFVSA